MAEDEIAALIRRYENNLRIVRGDIAALDNRMMTLEKAIAGVRDEVRHEARALSDKLDQYRALLTELPIVVDPGYSACPPTEVPDTVVPDAVRARQLAVLVREAFSRAGDPEVLTLAQILEHLAVVDPQTWRQWDGHPRRLALAGRMIAAIFRAGRLDMPNQRLRLPGRPTGYRLSQVTRAALIGPGQGRSG